MRIAAVSRNPTRWTFICGDEGQVYTLFFIDGQDWSGLNNNWREAKQTQRKVRLS